MLSTALRCGQRYVLRHTLRVPSARATLLAPLKSLPANGLVHVADNKKISGHPRGRALKAATSQSSIVNGAEGGDDLWIIVGLGNPGPRYADNRHNVGFKVIDALAQQTGIRVDKLQENAAVGRGRLAGKRILLAKPMTFMNASGEAVGRLARYYKVPKERVLVVYDDLDLSTGQVRLRGKGGHGGHNGMRSITQHFGGIKDFPRVRIGIDRPQGQKPVAAWVLEDFSKQEQEDVEFAVREAAVVVESVLSLGLEKALSGVRV